MKTRLLVIFLVLVLVPLGLLAWLGLRLVRDEQTALRQRMVQLLQDELQETGTALARLVERREQELIRLAGQTERSTEQLRELVRRTVLVRELLVLDADCARLHPPPAGPLTTTEQSFLGRAEAVWPDLLALCRRGSAPPGGAGATTPLQPDPPPGEGERAQGWYTWQWGGGGVDLIFWQRQHGGGLFGVEVDTLRLLAEIVGELPHAGPGRPERRTGRIALVDAGRRVLYRWGRYAPRPGEAAAASLSLAPPLSSWRLEHHLAQAELERARRGSTVFGLLPSLVLAAIALLALAFYFWRSQARQMREAMQKVSFVSRVSHELKTPLTNIRLYAELLEEALAEAEGEEGAEGEGGGEGEGDGEAAASAPRSPRRHLAVIVSESRRLSRLIGNVLTFSRHQRGRLALHRAPGRVDEVVRQVLEHFRLTLQERGVAVAFVPGAGEEPVLLDADVLEQILGNLLSNVEKYAAEGGRLEISTRQDAPGRTVIRVADHGPGIPPGMEEQVFAPFYRPSNRPSDQATGTGLGLGIARDLARLHGGDLRLVPAESGACFEVELRAPPVARAASSEDECEQV
ncbi:MAG: HAMP domain-containing histidine kinase [Deltaproteobacteria bacterium]|nr:HAMP domain-containing histidine kinase [Deltaproteobacteria bacterium]